MKSMFYKWIVLINDEITLSYTEDILVYPQIPVPSLVGWDLWAKTHAHPHFTVATLALTLFGVVDWLQCHGLVTSHVPGVSLICWCYPVFFGSGHAIGSGFREILKDCFWLVNECLGRGIPHRDVVDITTATWGQLKITLMHAWLQLKALKIVLT